MEINIDDVIGVKLPTIPISTPTVTVVMKDGKIKILRGAEASVFLGYWNNRRNQKPEQ